MGDASIGVRPYLGPGRFIMGCLICRVVVLVQVYRTGNFFGKALRHGVVGPWILRGYVGRAYDHLGAQCPQNIQFFLALFVGGRKNTPVPTRHGSHCQRYACIAARTFDDGPSGPQQAVLLGVFDHGHTDAVLDRPARIEILQLGQHRTGPFRRNPAKPHERGFAYCTSDIVVPHNSAFRLYCLAHVVRIRLRFARFVHVPDCKIIVTRNRAEKNDGVVSEPE